MPENKENYEQTSEEYDLGKKFNGLSEKRDFWISQIFNNEKKVDPFELKKYKDLVSKGSELLKSLVNTNKSIKLDSNQQKYYNELMNKTVEKKIADKRFDNIVDYLSTRFIHANVDDSGILDNTINSSTMISTSTTLNLSDRVEKPYEKQICIETIGMNKVIKSNGYATTDSYYSIRKNKDGSYLLAYGSGNSNFNPEKPSIIKVDTIKLDTDQLDNNLDKIVSKMKEIITENKNKENLEKKQKLENAEKIGRKMDIAQLDQKIDQAYTNA